ncbi:hypothetical protein NSA45_11185 [Paraclostridium bifermentans]|uniref:hypothetical protein n=1 Tax=Paraclostridium bifermentans TaxID=1490 RepID=UPI00214A4CFC|nr:hypothetical protein [Paraclostridium bifermentans]MCR1876433.1 hypothetical protein [Paraclostridium bifermentans]
MSKLKLKNNIKKDTESKDTIPTVNSYCMSFGLISQVGGIEYMRMRVWKELNYKEKRKLFELLKLRYSVLVG